MSACITGALLATGVAQVIVVLDLRPTAGDKEKLAAAGRAVRHNAATAAADLERHFVVSALSQDSALAAAAVETGAPLGAHRGRRTAPRHGTPRGDTGALPPAARLYPNLGVLFGTVSRDGLAALRADPRVASISGAPPLSMIWPQRVRAARLTRSVTWGVEQLGIPALWKQGLSGHGVLVGHLDTGADGRHPTLRGAIRLFADFDRLGRERRPAPHPYDTDAHGTHTAATIAGRPVAGKAVGVAPGAALASAIVIEGGNVVARVLGGMDWAVGQGVRVLSLSLGVRGWWEDFVPLTQILRARNILPVFAVGNEGPGTSRSPGNSREALSIGAVDSAGRVPEFSSSQRFRRKPDSIVPDLVAPGVDVISARPGSGYQAMDGTSMATPHITGLAALLFEAKPQATEDEVERAILQSCRRGPGLSRERANRGAPEGQRALAALVGA